LRELIKLVRLSEKRISCMSHQKILGHLYKLCWLNTYINALTNSKRVRRGLQSLAYALRSDLNIIVSRLSNTSLTNRMTELWEAEDKLDYPTLTQQKFRTRMNYFNCMQTLKCAKYYSAQACLYFVQCTGREIKASWDGKKQAQYWNWEGGILYSKDRWGETLELEGLSSSNFKNLLPLSCSGWSTNPVQTLSYKTPGRKSRCPY
jgi:hypothetical protein